MLDPRKVFGIPVNGFHPQMTAVSNPVGPNAIPPPSWPSYVQPHLRSTGTSSSRPNINSNRRRIMPTTMISSASVRGPPTTTTTTIPPFAPPPSSEIDIRTATVVRKLQDDARESDRSRSQLLRKRVRKEEKSHRRHLKQKMKIRRRTSDTTDVSSLSMSTTSSSSGTTTMSTSTSTSAGTSMIGGSGDDASSSACCSMKSSADDSKHSADDAVATTTAASPGVSTTSSSDHHGRRIHQNNDSETHFSELYSDVFMASDRPQFMATLGGRLVAWNDEFLSVTGVAKSQLRGCMTVHNLINSTHHPVLNDLFELALRGETGEEKNNRFMSSSKNSGDSNSNPPLVVVANGETTALSNDAAREWQIAAATSMATTAVPPSSISLERSVSPRSDLSDGNDGVNTRKREEGDMFTSLTLPCVSFPRSAFVPLQITIVLMNDIDPSRRCFYCILSPMEPAKQQQQQQQQSMLGGEPNTNLLYSAFLSAQQHGGVCVNVSGGQQTLLPLDAAKAFVIAPQTGTLGVIRRIDQEELANLLAA